MADNVNKMKFTQDLQINEVLSYLLNGIREILNENLIGLYLFGSLTYGDFNPESSDIDLVAIVAKPIHQNELVRIKQLHQQAGERFEKWGNRLECSYTPLTLLDNILPPKEPRPYYGSGFFYDEATYGNEWIINNYLLYQHGVPLTGPDFRELIKPISITEVQKACIRDLFQEWEPKIADDAWLENSHYQSYLVMNLCRILYTVLNGITGTKKVSAEWVKNQFALPWIRHLIEVAEGWNYAKKMSMKNEAIVFI